MGLETAQYVEDLNPLWPLSTDKKQEGDDQLRLLKSVLQNMTASQAQVTAKDNRVWLSASALAMDIDFTGAITKSGQGIATLGANTFTGNQILDLGAPQIQLKCALGQSSRMEFYEDGNRRGGVFCLATTDAISLIKYDAAGINKAQLDINEGGTINALVGQLQQGGTNVATLGSNTFTGNQAIDTGGSPVVSLNCITGGAVNLLLKEGDIATGRLVYSGTSNRVYLQNDTSGAYLDLLDASSTINAVCTNFQHNGAAVATVDQVNEIYGGYVNSSGTPSKLPSGWSISKGAAGVYTINHNLGLGTPQQEISVVVTAATGTSRVCSTSEFQANSFNVVIYTSGTATATDTAFTFMAMEHRNV